MIEDPNSRFDDVRRDLEYDYLALSYQMTHLMESRTRERAVLDEISRWVGELGDSSLHRLPVAESKKLIELTRIILSEADSVVRLGIQTSAFRDQFRVLQQRMAELGRHLGYW